MIGNSSSNVGKNSDTNTATSSAVQHSGTSESAVTTQQSGILGAMTPIILMLVAFYFLLMRPQQKREAKKREMFSSIKRGDKIVTAGGIIGTVHKIVSDKEISLEISENVRIRILRASINEVLKESASASINHSDDEKTKPESKKTHEIEQKSNLKNEKVKKISKNMKNIKKK